MDIWFERRLVARLIPQELGPALVYEDGWLNLRGSFPVSTSMPMTRKEYGPEKVLPWVVNLLPESRQLEAISRITRRSTGDVLGLLEKIGRDTSGALSFNERGATTMRCREIADSSDLEKILNELPKKPFLVGDDGISMSLAGVQTKIGVHIDDDGRIAIPIDGSPSTWILKPDSKELWGSVWNEAFCLKLAAHAGLEVPEIGVGRAGERRYLLVRRYDRSLRGERWRRLHQEDLCQALGIFPTSKYERNNTGTPGPRIPQMMDRLREVADATAPVRLLQSIIFNIACCNTDAHAKNYSLLIRGSGVTLAPIYDVMCGAVWPSITKNMANSISGKTRGDYLKGRHWQREAAACRINPGLLLRMVRSTCRAIDRNLDKTFDDLVEMDQEAEGMADLCRTEIRQRVRFLLSGLDEVEPNGQKGRPGSKHDARNEPAKPSSESDGTDCGL